MPLAPLPKLPEGRLARFAYGLRTPFRGARWLVVHPPLWPWAALPMLLTIWSVLGAAWLAWVGAEDLLGLWWPRPDGPEFVAWAFVHAMVVVSSFIAAALGLWVLGHLIAGPFYDRLAELVERQVLGPSDVVFSWRVAVGDALQSFAHSLLGLAAYVLVLVPLFALNLIPAVGSVLYAVIGALVTALFLARELFDVPLSRRRTSFLNKLRYLRAHRWPVLGLGVSTAVLLAIPLVDLLVLPCAVLGATLLFLSIELDQGRLTRVENAATPADSDA
ncbi:MAG: EI24 domain-containing protein [Proteobacteria bacterium]|nr:EI24 domain-containing protein [Pseudomonadota bacterium]